MVLEQILTCMVMFFNEIPEMETNYLLLDGEI